jgi:hypothetical protein
VANSPAGAGNDGDLVLELHVENCNRC